MALTPWLDRLRSQMRSPKLIWGGLAGGLWGLLAAGGATPRGRVVYDPSRQIVEIIRGDLPEPVTIPAATFVRVYISNLLQVALTFFVLCFIAGWVTWQHTRVQPRGLQQPPLRTGVALFTVVFLFAGLAMVLLFQAFHLAEWFRDLDAFSAIVVTGFIALLLPLYDGFGLFFLWLRRLESIRAPDWETHFPPPRDIIRPFVGRILSVFSRRPNAGRETDILSRPIVGEAEDGEFAGGKGGNTIE